MRVFSPFFQGLLQHIFMPALFLREAAHLVAAQPSWLLYRNVTLDGQNRAECGSDCEEDVPLRYLYFDGGIHDNRQFLAAIKTSCRVIFSGCSLERVLLIVFWSVLQLSKCVVCVQL